MAGISAVLIFLLVLTTRILFTSANTPMISPTSTTTDLDECASNPCSHGGNCTNEGNMFNCTCADGWTGTKCETDIDECASNPCSYGGNCTNGGNKFNCTCADGWTGTKCETDIDECASNPCSYGGNCTNEENMFTCTCADGWTGKKCETDIDECASNPCCHGGNCTNGENMFTCTCSDGWTGTTCETDTDECESNPCKNNGTCNNLQNMFRCDCLPGFAGLACYSKGKLGTDCKTQRRACDNITNAECNDKCICKEGFTEYTEMLGFCKANNVEYNGTCDVNISNETQCLTTNAKCINGRCVCSDDFFFLENNKCVKKLNADPCNLFMSTSETTNNTITLRWSIIPDNFRDVDNFSFVIIDVFQTDANFTKRYTKERNHDYYYTLAVTNLTAGTNYSFGYFLESEIGVPSNKTAIKSSFTRPLVPSKIWFDNVTSESFVLQWKDNPYQMYSNITFTLSPFSPNITIPGELCSSYASGNCTFSRRNNTHFIIVNGLTSGVRYVVNFYTIIGGLLSDRSTINSTYTVPLLPKVICVDSSIKNDSLTVMYNEPLSDFTDWILEIFLASNDSYLLYSRTKPKNESSALLDKLQPGTKYKIVVLTHVDGFNSSENSLYQFTRPSPPFSITIPKELVFAENFTVTYNVFDEMFDFFQLIICNVACKYYTHQKNTMNMTIGNLTSATYYNVTLYTVKNTTKNKLLSEFSVEGNSYTAPNKPVAVLSQSNFTSVAIDLSENNDNVFDSYEIKYKIDSMEKVKPINRNALKAIIPNLTPGTFYEFKVYTVLTKIKSENFTTIETFTRPENVQNVFVANTTTTSIRITWTKPTKGDAHSYDVNFTCKSPNENSNMEPYSFRNETEIESTVTGIDPGSHCNVSITTHIGSQIGCPLHIELNETSKETAPNNPVISCLKPGKRSLNVSWNEPTTPNGFVRKYQLLVVDKTSGCLKANHTYCLSSICVDDEDVYQEVSIDKCNGTQYSMKVVHELPREDVVEQLHPYRQYNVTVRAYTKCWGNFTWLNSETESDLPSAAPSIRTLIPTEEGFNISMVPPDEDDRNGVITNYTIRYTWINNTCWDSHDGEIVEETIYTNNESDHEVSNLRPYWYYNITVSASTKVGEGPVGWCDAYYVRTNTSIPGDVRNLTIITTSSNASLTWVTPCETNGIITVYSINITNNDTTITWENETDGNMTQFVVQNLLPYSNYSFSLAASTEKGIGIRSIDIEKRTDTAKPHQPRNPRADKTYSKRIDVKWDTPDLYTGPTRYFCVPVDDKNKNIKLKIKEVHGFKARTCTLTDLDEYWAYSITVTASTDRGNTSATFYVKTAEDKPGKVSYLELKSEKDVTKQRSVNVTWNEPSIRDRNGIIQNYSIVFTNSNNASTCFFTDSSTRYCNYSGLFPGNYSVEVFANTSAGNGLVVMKTVYVQPGAPLKINESEGGPLMVPSADQPKDTERQMAVNLPLKTFLCNTSNGYPTKWGVIVAQNDQATDEPFFGSVRDFTDRISKVYKTWFDVKDMDSIKPYLATYLNLSDSCQHINDIVTQTEHSTVMSHNIYKSCKPCLKSMELLSFPGTRKRRSVTQRDVETYQRFVVGLDGKCSGKQTDRFCNGELQPGRSYRVKTFACTIKGCTETKYSKPISTDPDLTVAVASGISSAIVVLAIVGVVVFVLRRKQLACFSKDDGRLVTQSPDEGIHLDKIEHTKKNPSSTPGQGPIKLSDFSDAVERFHRDSDLLFADAYKVLKEKSPSHPMTAAEQQCCRPKNRYTNILPFDHSRVKLRPSDDIEGSDYINANYIPGYSSRREYIATQGPMQATFDDFWRMVWEQNVDTIVMLTKLMEKGRRKCDKYWPDLGEPIFFGDLVVSLQSDSNMSDYNIKIFEVKTKTQRKMVRHFSYLKWPDMGCPETPELLLEFVKAVKQYSNREQQPSSNGPMIVHCSAGVGRTGTFIAVDYLLQHIKDHDEVDIFNLVLEMRNNRLNMVQTEDQYIYIHECIKSFITTQQEEEEQEDDDDEAIYVNTGFGADEENLYANT